MTVIDYLDILVYIINKTEYLQNKDYKAAVRQDESGASIVFKEIWKRDYDMLRLDLTKNGFSHVYLKTNLFIDDKKENKDEAS
jgi:hypothetical protein